jgi:hypothetical protein
MSQNRLSLSHLLLGFGFDYCAQPKAHAIEHRGHRTRRGPWLRALALRPQGFQGRLCRQSRLGPGGAKRWVLVRVRFRQPGQGCRCLGLRVCPTCATAEGRVRPETHHPCASFAQTHRNGRTAPSEDGFGQEGVGPTICHGPLSLKGTSCRSRHFGGRQTQIGDLRRTKRLMSFQR